MTRTKICPKCKLDLPASAYGLRTNGKWLRSYCKACESEVQQAWAAKNPVDPEANWRASLKRKFNITIERYYELLDQQDERCAICGTADPGSGRTKFAVDHCHETLEVRGLLCNQCNIGLGVLGDTVERVKQALTYLKGSQ